MPASLSSQALINLLENAIRHSGTQKPVEVVIYRKGSMDYVEVRDRGRGLKPGADDAATGGDSDKGLGIGLSVCRAIVQAHKGSFEGSNREGGGAVFTVGLPNKEMA